MPRRTHPRPNKGRRRYHLPAADSTLFCPCGKMAARTEQEAWDLAMGIHRARPGGDMPQRVYSCNDDGLPPFHWTRRP